MKGVVLGRAVVCFAIIFVHVHMYLFTNNFAFIPNSFQWNITNQFNGIGSIFFYLSILIGLSFSKPSKKQGLLLAGILYVTGLVINFSLGGIGYLFSWNFLQTTTISVLLLTFLSRKAIIWTFIIGIITYYPIVLILQTVEPFYGINILIGKEFYKYYFWPILPWVFAPLFGYSIKSYPFIQKYLIIPAILFATLAIIFTPIFELDQSYIWAVAEKTRSLLEFLGIISIGFLLHQIFTFLAKHTSVEKNIFIKAYSSGIYYIILFGIIVTPFVNFMKSLSSVNYSYAPLSMEFLYIYLGTLIPIFIACYGIGKIVIFFSEKKITISLFKK